MRTKICAGNWKMFKTTAETVAFFDTLAERLAQIPEGVGIVVCPPFTALQTARERIRSLGIGDRVALGAQNMHWAPEGAYTGAISARMLLDLGVRYTILGHSECRRYVGVTDEDVRRSTAAALENGITPIVAVGESLDVRRSGGTRSHVIAQTLGAIAGLQPTQIARIVMAYEPIWAIGTGHNCDPGDANEVMSAMRASADGMQDVPLLYGGSVKPDNMAQYAAQPDIDGGLVGGASLDPDSFTAIAQALRTSAP